MTSWLERPSLPVMPDIGQDAPRLEGEVFEAMRVTPQNPVWHAEGDVLTHTQMVCIALVADPTWQALPEQRREELWWAAMLHDCGKPARTRLEDGQLVSPGHSKAGEMIARSLLWRMGVAPERRERVCSLIRHHMAGHHLFEREQPERKIAEISLGCRCSDLAVLMRADINGRLAADKDQQLDGIELFVELCSELGCVNAPYPFVSDHARVEYFRHEQRALTYAAYDDTVCTVTLMVGLPGAGKDHWLARNCGGTVVSLDALREARKARRGDKTTQGQVIQDAREQLRAALRARTDVIFNATNLSAQQRGPVLGLAEDYNARVRMVCVETTPAELAAHNRQRDRNLTEAIDGLLRRWEFPQLTDAHRIEIV